jgi:hypothetical protein
MGVALILVISGYYPVFTEVECTDKALRGFLPLSSTVSLSSSSYSLGRNWLYTEAFVWLQR